MFHKVVWQHTQGVVWFLIIILVQTYEKISQWKKIEIRFMEHGVVSHRITAPVTQRSHNHTRRLFNPLAAVIHNLRLYFLDNDTIFVTVRSCS